MVDKKNPKNNYFDSESNVKSNSFEIQTKSNKLFSLQNSDLKTTKSMYTRENPNFFEILIASEQSNKSIKI